MAIISTSITDLNKLTKEQILTAIIAEQDALRAEQRDTVCTSQSGDTRGMLEQTWEARDGNGKLISTRQTKWTYHPKLTDGVHDVIQTETDGDGMVTMSRTIRHEGGRAFWVGEAAK